MKRVPLLKSDYPEGFNKVAKYIKRHWPLKLSLEASRQLLSKSLGYNSAYELERSFVGKLPNLIDKDGMKWSIAGKMEDLMKEQWHQANGDYAYWSTWRTFREDVFGKIPFHHLRVMSSTTVDVLAGVYDAVADRHPLYIESYRYGGYWGLFLPYADFASALDSAIDYDKTENLYRFLQEREYFPFGYGGSHVAVVSMISERVEKYFDESGTWRLQVYHPNIEEREHYNCLTYAEVWQEINSWFVVASQHSHGTPWYVIESKKDEGHWMFEALDDAADRFKKNEFYTKKEKPTSKRSGATTGQPIVFVDETWSFPQVGLREFMSSCGALPSKTIPVQQRAEDLPQDALKNFQDKNSDQQES